MYTLVKDRFVQRWQNSIQFKTNIVWATSIPFLLFHFVKLQNWLFLLRFLFTHFRKRTFHVLIWCFLELQKLLSFQVGNNDAFSAVVCKLANKLLPKLKKVFHTPLPPFIKVKSKPIRIKRGGWSIDFRWRENCVESFSFIVFFQSRTVPCVFRGSRFSETCQLHYSLIPLFIASPFPAKLGNWQLL